MLYDDLQKNYALNEPILISEIKLDGVSMNNIRYDVDNNVPTDYFAKWYWKSIEISDLTDGAENYMNYENYCKEAPDYWTEERVQKIRASKKRVEEAKNELLKAIEDTRKGKF